MPHFSSRFFFLLAFCTMSACICMAHSEWTEWRMVKTAAILCKFFFSFALFFFEPLDQDYSLYNVFAFYSVGTAFIFLLFFLFVHSLTLKTFPFNLHRCRLISIQSTCVPFQVFFFIILFLHFEMILPMNLKFKYKLKESQNTMIFLFFIEYSS